MHTLVTELWDEWSAFDPANADAVSAETAGLVAGLRAERDDGAVWLSTSRLWAVRRLLKLWKLSRWGTRLNIAGQVLVPPSMKGRVRLALPLELHEEVRNLAAPRAWDWVRGVWGGCGALYVPRSGYYLVMRTADESVAGQLGQNLRKARISAGGRRVRGTHELILRDQQEIVTFLSKIGLTGISLLMEDKAILRSMRDRANRMRNCDTANIRKSLRVAEEQTALAVRIRDGGLLPTLPPHLAELVLARLDRPEASLSELGEALSPSVTKSTVKYRWKRLCEFVGETDSLE